MDEHRNSDDGLHCISACFLLISCDTFSDQTNDTLSSFFIIFWFLLSLSLSGDSGVQKRIASHHSLQTEEEEETGVLGTGPKTCETFPA